MPSKKLSQKVIYRKKFKLSDLAIYPEGNYTQYSENNNKRTNDFLDDYRELKNYIETDKEFDTLESESDTSKQFIFAKNI